MERLEKKISLNTYKSLNSNYKKTCKFAGFFIGISLFSYAAN